MSDARDRSWRRFKTRVKGRNGGVPQASKAKPEKNWKMMYIRSVKLIRARQLGIAYPIRTVRQMLADEQPLDDELGDDQRAVHMQPQPVAEPHR